MKRGQRLWIFSHFRVSGELWAQNFYHHCGPQLLYVPWGRVLLVVFIFCTWCTQLIYSKYQQIKLSPLASSLLYYRALWACLEAIIPTACESAACARKFWPINSVWLWMESLHSSVDCLTRKTRRYVNKNCHIIIKILCHIVCDLLNFKIRGDRQSPGEWASLPLRWSPTQFLCKDGVCWWWGGEGQQEQNGEGERRRRGQQRQKKKEEDRQGADWEHVKLPGGRCDSPKQQSNHLKQRFNEAAWGGWKQIMTLMYWSITQLLEQPTLL